MELFREESLPRRSRGPTAPGSRRPIGGRRLGAGTRSPGRARQTPAAHPGSPGSGAGRGGRGPGSSGPGWAEGAGPELSSMLATVGSLLRLRLGRIPCCAPGAPPDVERRPVASLWPRGHPQYSSGRSPGRSESPGSGEQGLGTTREGRVRGALRLEDGGASAPRSLGRRSLCHSVCPCRFRSREGP